MSRNHAILGPSSASKWMACPPSARLELTMPHATSEAADEGTLAHSLGELIIAHRTQQITNKVFREQLAAIESNPLYNKAMYEYCDGYAIYVLETLAAAKAVSPNATLVLEEHLDTSEFIPEGFGFGDAAVLTRGYADVIDLKYGKGVSVSAENNSQLKIYALGWLEKYDLDYGIHTIRLHIYQPRMNNISVWAIGYADLMGWANLKLKPVAEMAFKGEGEFAAGKHCQFCKAKATCRANAAYQVQIAQLEFADIADFDKGIDGSDPVTLTDAQVSAILTRAEAFTNWVKTVKDYALDQAKAGKTWPGFKLVSGKSRREFTDLVAVEKLLIKEGFDRTKLFKPQELIGITEMEKLTGKKLFDEKIATYTIKAPGAPTLVDESDPREPINNAQSDFNGVEID